jgi:hypothetical protein
MTDDAPSPPWPADAVKQMRELAFAVHVWRTMFEAERAKLRTYCKGMEQLARDQGYSLTADALAKEIVADVLRDAGVRTPT